MDKKNLEVNRVYYFDWLRTISIFSVIFMHIVAEKLRSGINTSWHIANLLTSFAFIAVPIFFMISGALTLNEKSRDIEPKDIVMLTKKN